MTSTRSATTITSRQWAGLAFNTSSSAPATTSSGATAMATRPCRPPRTSPTPTRSPGPNNQYTADGRFSNCSDPVGSPGVLPIVHYLDSLGDELKANCESGHYYMLNNTHPGFLPNGQLDTAGIANGISIPPSSVRTIGDALNERGISWAYYAGAYNAAANPMNALDVLIGPADCTICNFEAYA